MKNEPILGQLAPKSAPRDAVHVAVIGVTAKERMLPGSHVHADGTPATPGTGVGVVDPFLTRYVEKGDTFYLCVYPRTITSLRHDWAHPKFEAAAAAAAKSASEVWMRAWAVEHMGEDYYDEDGDGKRSEDDAYESAIRAGHNMSVGPYESARDYIDNEWWSHWEIITGCKGQRDEYFSCGC